MNLMCIEVYTTECAAMSMNRPTLITLEVKFHAVLCEGLGLGLETRVSRPRTRSLDLGLKTRVSWSRVFLKRS